MLPVVVLVCLISHDGNHLYVAEALIPDFCVLCRCLHKHGCCKSGVCCKNRETQVKLAVYAQANKHALQTPGGSRNQEIRNYGVGACACDCAVRVAEASNALSGSRTHLLYMYGVRGDFFLGCSLGVAKLHIHSACRGIESVVRTPPAVHGCFHVDCRHTCVLQVQGVCGHASGCGDLLCGACTCVLLAETLDSLSRIFSWYMCVTVCLHIVAHTCVLQKRGICGHVSGCGSAKICG